MEVDVHNGEVQAVKASSQNFVDVSERPKQIHGQEAVRRPACITSYKKSHKIVNKHVGDQTSDIRENEKQVSGVPVLTQQSGQVLRTHVVTKSQSVTAANCRWSSSSGTDGKAPSSCVVQGQENKYLKQSLGNVQPGVRAETDIVCISDSDDEIEFLASNAELDIMCDRKKPDHMKLGTIYSNDRNQLDSMLDTYCSKK